MGDLFFNGYYPYIGVSSGGTLPGMIKVINWTLNEMDDNTIVVPGHGPVTDKAGLKVYVDMLTAVYQLNDGPSDDLHLDRYGIRRQDGTWKPAAASIAAFAGA